ncbi:SRPBCC family protein [Streptomyces johnsoniae]|uniref:SRPBCC family protein n=1 Tax=Streptomyces johnsoniae TaxID=3075532 RepID=A0ABU2RX90_9ACTN|nr:SRPBCC family protein [Streptomyces sp. DSM 41886]MDT0441325.1 SRPBCC family protein [Streptomyces sp. DSM 41886]
MEKKTQSGSDGLAGGLERLGTALIGLVEAQAKRLADTAGQKITDLAGRVGESAAPAAAVPKAGAALAGQGAKQAKDHAVGTAKKAVGKGGEDSDDGGDAGGGGGGGGKSPDAKVTSIIETIDVGVPLRDCYNHWTSYDNFSDFMKGVQSVDRSDDTTSEWKLKIGPSNRSWKATVQEQIPDQRIEWRSEGGKGSTRGVVTFHEVARNLTRIVVVVEYYPAGFFEKTANLWRAQGRRLRLDLKQFQRYVTLVAEETPPGWRGEVRDGEVVRGPDEEENGNGDDDEDLDDEDEDEDDEDEDEDEDDDEERDER